MRFPRSVYNIFIVKKISYFKYLKKLPYIGIINHFLVVAFQNFKISLSKRKKFRYLPITINSKKDSLVNMFFFFKLIN